MGIQQEVAQTSAVSKSSITDFSKNVYFSQPINKLSTFTESVSPKVETKKKNNNNSSLIIKINAVQKQRELETQQLWRNADAVCFDVDSTVCRVII